MKFWNLEPSADGEVLDVSILGDIGASFFSEGVTAASIDAQLKAHAAAKKIKVQMNTLGGDAFEGIAIHNLLRAHGAQIEVTIVGVAASAGSIIAMAGHKVVMGPGSMLMVHDPWTMAAGSADDLRATAEVLDSLRDGLVTIYQAKTGKKPAELRALLKAETWMTAEEAKAAGFADEISGKPVKAKAEGETVFLNSVAFPRAKVPEQLLALTTEPASLTLDMLVAAAESIVIDRALLARRSPELLAALLDEGRALAAESNAAAVTAARNEGVTAERARLQAIDDLALPGCEDLVRAAKYENNGTAESLALAAVKAGKGGGADAFLAARRKESEKAAGIAPTTTNEGAESVAKQIAAYANARRGGAR